MTINQGLDEKLFAILDERVRKIPFYNFLGFQPEAMGKGYFKFSLQTVPEYANINDTLHGGVMMSIADAVMAFAVRTLGVETTTVNLSSSFFSSAPAITTLIAEGTVLKEGNHLVFCESKLIAEEKTLGVFKGTFYVLGKIQA